VNAVDNALDRRDGPTGSEVAGAVALFVFQIVAAFLFYILTIFFSMAADGCTQRQCNFIIAGGAIYLAPIAALGALAITIPLTIRSGKRRGSIIIPPLVGVSAVIIGGILGLVLNHIGLS
jgi:hypothetical protein